VPGSSNILRRLRRLAQMDRVELITRSKQALGKRIDGALSQVGWEFGNTGWTRLTSAPPGQFFFEQEEVPRVLSLLRERMPAECEQIVCRADRICQHRFDLLGYENLDYGPDIDWRVDRVHGKHSPNRLFYKIHYLDFAECGDAKVTWELNRHQHLVNLAKAYRITNEERFASEIFHQWDDWHRKNPYPIGINWVSSLEVAFRSLSWFWMFFLLGPTAEQRPAFREQFLQAQAVNGRCIERYLSTYFAPNTHLLGEAVALFFLGTLIPELPAAERWRRLGWETVVQEAQRQVRPDGLHFEQSVYYHVYALDFFLHARILASKNGIQIPPAFDETLQNMLTTLCHLGRGGSPPRLGDDDGGRLFDGSRNRSAHLLDPLATGAVLYRRGDFKFVAGGLREETLWLLGGVGAAAFDQISAEPPAQDSVALTASGLYLMADAASGGQIVIDAGPMGSGSCGHGHADALSICFRDADGPVLIDSGTCEYVGDGPERNLYRGTSAHNTLVVDGRDQATPKGPFAWADYPDTRAEVWVTGKSFDLFMGSHNGYQRLDGNAMHRRWVFSLKSRFWLVRDVVEGNGQHQLDIFWRLAPEFSPLPNRDGFVNPRGKSLNVVTAAGWLRTLEQGVWSPVYGRAGPTPVLHFGTVAELPCEFVTLFRTGTEGTEPGELQMDRRDVASGYRYLMPDEQHAVIFANSEAPWTLGPWTSDAGFLYWGFDRYRERGSLIFCNGSYVNFGGQPVVSSSQRIERCEIMEENRAMEVYVSDNDSVVVHCPELGGFIESEPEMPENQAAGRNQAGS